MSAVITPGGSEAVWDELATGLEAALAGLGRAAERTRAHLAAGEAVGAEGLAELAAAREEDLAPLRSLATRFTAYAPPAAPGTPGWRWMAEVVPEERRDAIRGLVAQLEAAASQLLALDRVVIERAAAERAVRASLLAKRPSARSAVAAYGVPPGGVPRLFLDRKR